MPGTPVDPHATDALIKLYKKTYNDILGQMQTATAKQQVAKNATLQSIKAQLEKLGVKTDSWVNKNIPNAFNEGRKVAVKGLMNLYEIPVYHTEGGVNGGALLGRGYYVSFDKSVAREFGDGPIIKSYLKVYDPNQAYIVRSQRDIDKVFKAAVKMFPKENPQQAMTKWYLSKGFDIAVGKDDPMTGILVANPKVLSTTPVTVDDGFSVSGQKMLKALVNSTTQSFGESLSGVGRDAKNVFTKQLQAEIKQQLASGTLQGEARDQIVSSVRQTLSDTGLTAIRDKAGRSWSLDRYADMLARTQLSEARNNGLMVQMLENNQDLVQVSLNGSDHVECAQWEGEVLSISGNTPGFATLDDAEASGLFHPNCMHTINAYEDGLSDLLTGWNSETGQYEDGLFAQDGYTEVKISKDTQDAIDAGAMPLSLANRGYSMDSDGNPFDPKGNKMSIGKFQQAAQSKTLTNDENLIRRGLKTFRQAEEDV